MKIDRTRTRPSGRLLITATVLALGGLVSFASLALPVTPANGWLTYTYYNGEGEIVGQRSQGVCPGMEPIYWGVKTTHFTYQTGQCNGGGLD